MKDSLGGKECTCKTTDDACSTEERQWLGFFLRVVSKTATYPFMMAKNQKVRKPLLPGRAPVPPGISSGVPKPLTSAHSVTWNATE